MTTSNGHRRPHELERIEVTVQLAPEGEVVLEAIGRASDKRTALWVQVQHFDAEDHLLTPLDEVYALLHDVLVARPNSKVEYEEARRMAGQITAPFDW